MPKSNWQKKTAPSGNYDLSTGGDRLFVQTPGRDDDWQSWGFDFQLITEPIGFVQHNFEVQDPSNVPIPEYRDEPLSWLFVPCVGSTGEENEEGEMKVDPEGVAECQKIVIPGTDISLHNCDKMENGRTQTMYRAAIFNWDGDCFQILEMKSYAWEQLFDALNRTMERKFKQGEDFDFHAYTCYAETQETQGAAPYRYNLSVVATDHYSFEQVKAKAQEDEHQERYNEVRSAANPTLTAEEVRKRIGAIDDAGEDSDSSKVRSHGADEGALDDLGPEMEDVDDLFEDDEEEIEPTL